MMGERRGKVVRVAQVDHTLAVITQALLELRAGRTGPKRCLNSLTMLARIAIGRHRRNGTRTLVVLLEDGGDVH